MSIQFENPVNDEARKLIEQIFGPVVSDERTFLPMARMPIIDQIAMKQIANAAKQPATVALHADGDVKTLADGTQYRARANGWVRI